MRRRNLRISLWCEWPDQPHALDNDQGVYTLTSHPPWLRDYLPFLRALIATLGIAVPLIAPAITLTGMHLDDQTKAGTDTASGLLHAARLPHNEGDIADFWAVGEESGPERRAETVADFRVLRGALRELDPQQLWSGLSPAIRPEDYAVVYLCDRHLRALDHPYQRTTNPAKTQ